MIVTIMLDALTLSVVTNVFATTVTKVMANTVIKRTLMNVPLVPTAVTNTQHVRTLTAVTLVLVTVVTMVMVTVVNKTIPTNVLLGNTTVPLMLNAKTPDGVSNASASRDIVVMVSIAKPLRLLISASVSSKLPNSLHFFHSIEFLFTTYSSVFEIFILRFRFSNTGGSIVFLCFEIS